MKKFVGAVSGIALLAGLLSGCGAGGGAAKNGTSASPATAKFKIGMVTDVGGVHDNSYNQSAWTGLQKFGKDHASDTAVKYLESKSADDYTTNLNEFVKNNWNLVWAVGFAMDKAIEQAAQANPKTDFGIIDSDLGGKIPSNVVAVTFKSEQGAFLVGVVAGLMTKTNKIGFVGGVNVPIIQTFQYGFQAGVKSVNPKAQVLTAYTGSFTSPDLGKQAAATMYDQGADIVFGAAGATGDGIFNEAKQRLQQGKKVWVIGVDSDQAKTFGNEVTLTSDVKRVDNAVYKESTDFENGNFAGGKDIVLGLKDDAVGLADTHVNIPQNVMDQVNKYKQDIIDGKITVPATKDDYTKFVSSLK